MFHRLAWVEDGFLGSPDSIFNMALVINDISKSLVAGLSNSLAFGIGESSQINGTLPGCGALG